MFIVFSHVVESAHGGPLLKEIIVKDIKTNQSKSMEVSGLFFAIGHTPNTQFLNNQLETDETG